MERKWCDLCGIVTDWFVENTCIQEKCPMKPDDLPRLKPGPGELTVECPKCYQRVSETCCAYQDYEYYKDCYCYLTRAGIKAATAPDEAIQDAQATEP